MRIDINKIKAKNFFSIGNNGIEFDYRGGLYRVTGDNQDSNGRNGAGKSVVLCETLAFALYGKPIRRISKDEMLNSVNMKGCEVEIHFSKEKDNYIIERGIKPNYVRIHKNGELLDENANMKSTQKEIERIVGSDYQTFTHLLVMSNSYSTPFMDLNSEKKRTIIEDVLGISVLGKMSDIIKRDYTELRSNIKIQEKECEYILRSYNELKEQNDKLKSESKTFEEDKKNKLVLLDEKKSSITDKKDKLLGEIYNEDNLRDKENKLRVKENKLTNEINSKKTENKFNKKRMGEIQDKISKLQDNPTCPICKTSVGSDHIVSHMEEINKELDTLKECIGDNKNFINKTSDTIDLISDKLEEIESVYQNNTNIKDSISELELKLNKIKSKKELVESHNNTAMSLVDDDKEKEKRSEYKEISSEINELVGKLNNLNFMKRILSDDGIKNYIIKKVIKFWNMKVNSYLSEMNVNFSIHFDENLESTMKSRSRDVFSYHNFSGGERSRIDVAILLAMLDLSRLQNNIDLNLMVIDELFDSAIDSSGREEILGLFKNKAIKENKSIYVISHSADLPIDMFDKEVTVYKKNGFTHL